LFYVNDLTCSKNNTTNDSSFLDRFDSESQSKFQMDNMKLKLRDEWKETLRLQVEEKKERERREAAWFKGESSSIFPPHSHSHSPSPALLPTVKDTSNPNPQKSHSIYKDTTESGHSQQSITGFPTRRRFNLPSHQMDSLSLYTEKLDINSNNPSDSSSLVAPAGSSYITHIFITSY
jgi:hypothetical protein